ncbi:aromatic-ring-hydroxylating dioxygenase subunit beta [Sphingomonas sp.]|uniref:aromatic-ring-hydroxylating dioxygenase subunit beta n=1 Tax=Sphingomonas sp. TaxID=28214 RepID=UPI000DB09CB9|nr:aromatic-ring-hydroxylating dioxygenase subunit beta [Sphingomonas sp.]PZU06396.1 MAG: hypothetical protein DI605_19050 [Sphingomonas sp.]
MSVATLAAALPPETMAIQNIVQWFIWKEAELLDRQDYKTWMGLWSPGGLYIIPTEFERQDSYAGMVNVLYDDADMRAARIKRMTSGFAAASNPSARTARQISRFVIEEQTPQAINVCATMLLTEYKYEHTRILAADVDYRLAIDGNDLQLDRKVVRLINADDFLPTIGYLL